MAGAILPHPDSAELSCAELSLLHGEKAIAEAQSRLKVVLDFKTLRPKTVCLHGQRVPSPAVEELAQNASVGLGTLWRWYRSYRSSHAAVQGNIHAKAKAGFEALIPRRRGQVTDSAEDLRVKVDAELRQAIAGLFARRQRPSITKVWRKLIAQCPQCKQRPLEPLVKSYLGKNRLHRCPECEFELSYSTVRRVVLSIPPPVRTLGREGRKAFEGHYGVFIPRSYEDLRNREIFCGDHHEFDLFVHSRSGKLIRPWISAWLDLKTEVLAGWFISERPNSQTIALAFRHAVLPKPEGIMGLPESIYVDHGRDFRSHYLEGQTKRLGRIPADSVDLFVQAQGLGVTDQRAMDGLWQSLGITVRHAIPFNAQAKPIERFFGTVERDLVQDLPGWCASKVDLRPADILKVQVARHQAWMKGETADTPFLHIAEFALLFEKWLHENYLSTPHARLGCSPLEAYRREYGTPMVLDERSLDILLMRAERRLVRRNGLELFERSRWYWSEKLAGREGTYVEVRWDPRDLSKILVYTEAGFLCEAFNLQLSNFHPTLEQLRQYKRMKKLQRDLVFAQLELMHMAADELLAVGTGKSKKPRLDRALDPSLAQPMTGTPEPVFTSQAAREAWFEERNDG